MLFLFSFNLFRVVDKLEECFVSELEEDIYELRSKIVVQDTDKQNKQHVQEQEVEAEATNSQKEENKATNKSREDYTNLKGIYSAKAVVQLIFGAGVLYAAYSDFNLLPSSALIYLTGTLFDLIVATSMNKGPKYKVALVIFKLFKWVNIAAVAFLFFIVLNKVDIGKWHQAVFWTIGVIMVCLGIISSVVELVLNRPNDD